MRGAGERCGSSAITASIGGRCFGCVSTCSSYLLLMFFFFFQAEDGIRDGTVTGVQTCALPISIFDTNFSQNAGAGAGIPRYVPGGSLSKMSTGTPVNVGPNTYDVLVLPAGNSFPFDPNLGISDFGPYPADMTGRNAFRGPGAWNFDVALTKSFALSERFRLEFRAEGFNIFNHHNFYVLQTALDVANFTNTDPVTGAILSQDPVHVTALKGGLGTNNVSATNHDERRFGQFALRLTF